MQWPPPRFWQYWALAGMVILTAAFWWSVEGRLLHASNPFTDGLLRFSLIVLTPALVIGWCAAAWLRGRVGEKGYWQLLGLIAIFWAADVALVHLLLG